MKNKSGTMIGQLFLTLGMAFCVLLYCGFSSGGPLFSVGVPIENINFKGTNYNFASNAVAAAFQAALDAKSTNPYTKLSYVTNLFATGSVSRANFDTTNANFQAQINAKASQSNFDTTNANFQSQIDGKVASTRTLNTTAPITGGGDFSADRTLAMAAATASVDGYLTAANWLTFNTKQPGNRYLSNIANMTWVRGDLAMFNGTDMVRIAAGTSGYFLKSQGPSNDLVYAAIAGGGDVLAANNGTEFTPSTFRGNLGLAIGSDIQQYSFYLKSLASNSWIPGDMAVVDSNTNFIRMALPEATATYTGTNVALDFTQSLNLVLTPTNNFRINSITGQRKGLTYGLRIVQDSTGNRVWSYTNGMLFSSAQTLTTNGSAFDFVSMYCYNGTGFVCSALIKNPQ